MTSQATKNMPALRFARRFAFPFKIRDRKLIKIGTANMIDNINTIALVTGISEVPETNSCKATGSCKRAESPWRPLTTRPIHKTDRIILTSTTLLKFLLFVPRGGSTKSL